MEFGLLGPLLVRSADGVVEVPGPRQRALLAALLLRANRTVPNDALIEAVWDGRSSPGAVESLPSYVMRLRRVLGPEIAARISTRPGGYAIEVDDAELDVNRFRAACARARRLAEDGAWAAVAELLGEALALWRGEPLADVPVQNALGEELRGLSELRLDALRARVEADLELGRHHEVVPELQRAIAENPLHEPLRGQLMLALYRAGRQADALEVYRNTRETLAEELGVEPTPPLRELHQRILNADASLTRPARAAAPRRTVPRQLPAAVRHFAGRDAQIRALTELVEETSPPGGTVVISAIDGTAGIGKTALAVHWAHQVSPRFPDGQLYVNLRGFDPSGAPIQPAEAVRGFLDALGVPPQRIPVRLDEQAALYRSRLADQRMLVVLDNARDAEQVRPLLPGSPGCLVLVTSRNQLAGLIAAQGARPLTLDLLDRADAHELITRRLGPSAGTQRRAVDDLIDLCARLPLALNIVAARAALNPAEPLADLVARLRADRRLDVLDAGEATTDVRAVFSWSYQQLSAAAARMFRLLGVHPGPDISLPAAAGLAGLPRGDARAALRELTTAHLLTEQASGRFAFHDLLRAYAAELAGGHDTDADRRAATHRMLDHYVHTARGAMARIDPARAHVIPAGPCDGAAPEEIADDRQAWRWFEAELPILLACVTRAAEARFDTHAWQLPSLLGTFLTRQGLLHTQVTVQTVAVAAAERLGDREVTARTLRAVGLAHARLGDYDEAHRRLRQALELYRDLDDATGQGNVHNSLAWVLERQGRHREVLDHAGQALALYRAVGNRLGQAETLNAIGWSESQLGDYEQALAHCEEALALHRDLDDNDDEAGTLDSIGYIYHRLGRHAEALASYRAALAIFRDVGDRYYQAVILDHLADTCVATGDLDAARAALRESADLFTELGRPDDAEQIRVKLAGLG